MNLELDNLITAPLLLRIHDCPSLSKPTSLNCTDLSEPLVVWLSVAQHSWTSCILKCSSVFLRFFTWNISHRLSLAKCNRQGLFQAISVFFLIPPHHPCPQNIQFASCLPASLAFTASPHFFPFLLPESALSSASISSSRYYLADVRL